MIPSPKKIRCQKRVPEDHLQRQWKQHDWNPTGISQLQRILRAEPEDSLQTVATGFIITLIMTACDSECFIKKVRWMFLKLCAFSAFVYCFFKFSRWSLMLFLIIPVKERVLRAQRPLSAMCHCFWKKSIRGCSFQYIQCLPQMKNVFRLQYLFLDFTPKAINPKGVY